MSECQLPKTELIFKNNLIYLRQRCGFTPYHVAKQCGFSTAYYYRLENMKEKTNPKWTTFEALAVFYGLEPDALLKQMS